MVIGFRTTDDLFGEALELVDIENYEKALPLLARVVAFDSTNAVAYELWVGCHIYLKRYARAIELIQSGLDRGIAPSPLNVQKALALELMGQHGAAADAAKQALALDPVSTDAVLALASAEISRGEFDAACDVYRDALRNNPEDEAIHFALLELANDRKQHTSVVEVAREYLRRFEKNAEVLAMLGHAYVHLGDIVEQIARFATQPTKIQT